MTPSLGATSPTFSPEGTSPEAGEAAPSDWPLGSVPSIPPDFLTMTSAQLHVHDGRGGGTEPNGWRYWMARAYRAWLARSEQLSLFEEWLA